MGEEMDFLMRRDIVWKAPLLLIGVTASNSRVRLEGGAVYLKMGLVLVIFR